MDGDSRLIMELYDSFSDDSHSELSGKFVPTNLYNLINVLKFKSSAFQFSFKICMNFPDNPILKILFL